MVGWQTFMPNPLSGRRLRHMGAPELAEMVTRYKELKSRGLGIMEACEAVALELGRETSTIYHAVRRLQPTTDLAQTYLQSQALRLAVRAVRKANVTEAIDILSRKNMGVLAPKTEEQGGAGGFFLSVQADSCGAVKIGIATNDSGERARSASLLTGVQQTQETIDVPQESRQPHDRTYQGRIRPASAFTQGHTEAVRAAKERLKKAQRRRRRYDKHQKNGGLQVLDGQSQGPEVDGEV